MMAFNTLRIDAGDGSPIVHYRIENGRVERHVVEAAEEELDPNWRQLTPEEISAHVMADTVIAHWLRGRMGLYQLIQACSPDYPSARNCVQDNPLRTGT
jgi:hypothetical protein